MNIMCTRHEYRFTAYSALISFYRVLGMKKNFFLSFETKTGRNIMAEDNVMMKS